MDDNYNDPVLQKRTNRRRVLTGISIIAAGGVGYWFAGGNLPGGEIIDDLDATLSNNVNSISWDDGSIIIDFAQDHDGDGFLLLHEYHDNSDNSIVSGSIPEFGGEITVNFIRLVEDDWENYPTPNFKIQIHEGSFSDVNRDGVNLILERIDTVSFTVPEEKRPKV